MLHAESSSFYLWKFCRRSTYLHTGWPGAKSFQTVGRITWHATGQRYRRKSFVVPVGIIFTAARTAMERGLRIVDHRQTTNRSHVWLIFGPFPLLSSVSPDITPPNRGWYRCIARRLWRCPNYVSFDSLNDTSRGKFLSFYLFCFLGKREGSRSELGMI